MTPGRLLGVELWKLWGRTVETNYVEGRWHQNCLNSTLGSVVSLAMFLYEITLSAIDIDNIGRLGPFLPL